MRIVSSPFILIALGVAAAVGCSSAAHDSGFASDTQNTDPNDSDGGTGQQGSSFGSGSASNNGLVLNPANTTVIIDTSVTPAAAGTVTYKVANNGMDVTTGAMFTLSDPSIGSFNGTTFTSVASLPTGLLGKSATVSAVTSAGTALGSLTVVALRKAGAERDFFFIEPYKDTPSPTTDTLKFNTNIQQVDVAFVMDTTASMGNEITGLTNAIGGNLITQLQAAIPDVGIGVVSHRDVVDGTDLLKVFSPITATIATAQAAVKSMQNAGANGGGDLPEAQVAAMDFVLTGNALVSNGQTLVPGHTSPPGGFFGGVDFRPGSVPVVVEITDANWHDPSAGISAKTLAADFVAKHARFISVAGNDGEGNFEGQANALSDATNSNLPPAALTCGTAGQCCTGANGAARAPTGPNGTCRLNYVFSTSSGSLGTTFTDQIAQAIKGISVGSQFDVTAKAANDPMNANGVDATKFIKALRARDEGDPTNNCPAHAATDTDGDGIKDTFTQVLVGTPVCFEIIPAVNTTVSPQKDPQFYKALVNVVGVQGNVQLDSRAVLFLVPPGTPGVN